MRSKYLDSSAITHDLELIDRAGPLQVCSDKQRGMTLSLKPFRDLPGQGRLTRTLQASEHDDGGRRLGEDQLAGLPTEDRDQLLVDDLDDLLGRVEGGGDLGALRPLFDAGNERADDRQRDVGLE